MDIDYFNKEFKITIEQMVRNYIFELDKSLPDGDDNKFYFDKEYDHVKVFSVDRHIGNGSNGCGHIHVTYQIFDSRTGKPTVFKEPVDMKIDIWQMMVCDYKYLNDKVSGRF